MMLGSYDEAEKSITKGFSYGEELYYASHPELALMYKKLGKQEEALSILNKLKLTVDNEFSKRKRIEYYYLYSEIYSILNEKEKALNNLSEAVRIGLMDGDADLLLITPIFENLREDPEFIALAVEAKNQLEKKRAQVREMMEKGEFPL
jgi:tetratricopeptide (TPR) repeat protein